MLHSALLDPHSPEYWDARAHENAASPAAMVGWQGMPFEAQGDYIKGMLEGLVTPGARVLDVDCGYGRFALTVVHNEAHWIGIDFSKGMAGQFLEHKISHPRAVYHIMDARNPAPALGKFDPIFCVGGYRTCGFESIDQFNSTYEPFIKRPGHILTVECNESIVRNYW